MNNVQEKYLPLGTVVRLQEGEKYLMIIGFCSMVPERPEEIIDYNACLYPEGVLSSQESFLFNHDQIAEIIHLGLSNEEDVAFKTELKDFISKHPFSKKNDDNSQKTVSEAEAIQPIEIPIMQQAAPMVDLSDVSQMVETLDVNNQN